MANTTIYDAIQQSHLAAGVSFRNIAVFSGRQRRGVLQCLRRYTAMYIARLTITQLQTICTVTYIVVYANDVHNGHTTSERAHILRSCL